MNSKFKPISDDTKESLYTLFDSFLKDECISSGRAIAFQWLESSGYLIVSKSVKLEACRKAIRYLLKKDSKLPANVQKPYLYNRNSCFMVKCKAKTLLLEDYFAKIDANGKHLKDILK